MSSYDHRKQFLEQLGVLSRAELEEIFRIIKRNNDIFSENTNGIFFNVADLREDTFIKLNDFMNFCMKNREEQMARVEEMKSIRDECITNKDIVPTETLNTT
jgi:hypothetical protein